MLRRVMICAVLVTAALVPVLHSRPALSTASQAVEPAHQQRVLLPGTDYEVVPGSVGFRPAGNPSAQQLLAALMAWTSVNFDLPATDELPNIEFAPATTITALRHEGLSGWQQERPIGFSQAGQREVVSVYDDATRTVYVPEGWTGSTPAELSVLVHEIVHHLQNVARLRFECPQQREQLAYEVQERWLNLFGGSLEDDFQIDPFTLLVSTTCGL